MINKLLQGQHVGIEWIDVVFPDTDDVKWLATNYHLHEALLNDCLQPGHLPKYENMDDYDFIIIRNYHNNEDAEADTVQEITSKIAVFISTKFIITIHRKDWSGIAEIENLFARGNNCKGTSHILNEIVKLGLKSYDAPGQKLTDLIEYYERQVFLTERKVSLLKGLYYIKRKLDVIKRLLLLTNDIIDRIDDKENTNAYTRDIRDLYVKQKSLYDALLENVNHLLNIYFNISAQRTNETMRILTIFSVFFMPLTFIVGIYGMNFKFMPELEWRYGYPISILAMLIVIIVIYRWFKRKKWL